MRMENPLCMLLDRLFFGTFSISLRIAWAYGATRQRSGK
jgi:hypothetical protein